MTTATRRETRRVDMAGGSSCEGCPRCSDPEAGFCRMPHPQYSGLHPVCKSCGALRAAREPRRRHFQTAAGPVAVFSPDETQQHIQAGRKTATKAKGQRL